MGIKLENIGNNFSGITPDLHGFKDLKKVHWNLNRDEIWDDAVNTWNKSGVKQLLQTSKFDKNIRSICDLTGLSFTFHGYEDVFKEKLKKDF